MVKDKPSFMSVTYGAGGGTSKYTLEIARNIRERYGVPTVAHLTCVSSSRELVRERIEDMKAAGIENVMALRGDLTPELAQGDRSGWAYHHAVELVREAEISGRVGTETSRRAAALTDSTGLDPDIRWSKTGRIQLNEEVTVTLTLDMDIGLFGGFGSFPITLRSEATGKSEVYWK